MTRPSTPAFAESIKEAVVRVGAGCGFLVKTRRDDVLVITAAHCLPHLPPAHPASYTHERTYGELLGPRGTSKPTVWAECVFVDPIGDLAVLSAPDGQARFEEWEAYQCLVDDRPTLRLTAVTGRSPAWVLPLDGSWERCAVDVGGRGQSVILVGAHIDGGMSGSPIRAEDGRVVGVVCLGAEIDRIEQDEQHGQPALVGGLPGWLLAELLTPLKSWPALMAAQSRAWGRYLRRPAGAMKTRRYRLEGFTLAFLAVTLWPVKFRRLHR